MAHFARLNENKQVIDVIVVSNDVMLVDGVESEAAGLAFCASLSDHQYVQTSYNSTFRTRYAMIGGTYDESRDEFVDAQPFPSWSLDSMNVWQPPVPKPSDLYEWNESDQTWVLMPQPETAFPQADGQWVQNPITGQWQR